MGLLTGAVPATPDAAAGTAGSRVAGGTAAAGGSAIRRSDGASRPGEASGAVETAERIIRLWRRLGLSLDTCAEQAVITPACGLAGASPAQARAALDRCREAAGMLPELIEETGEELR